MVTGQDPAPWDTAVPFVSAGAASRAEEKAQDATHLAILSPKTESTGRGLEPRPQLRHDARHHPPHPATGGEGTGLCAQ